MAAISKVVVFNSNPVCVIVKVSLGISNFNTDVALTAPPWYCTQAKFIKLKTLFRCGRSDFLIHGCGCCSPGDTTVPPVAGCSAGCVVINVENRMKLRANDTLIVK